THEQLLLETLQRDERRVRWIESKAKLAGKKKDEASSTDLNGPVTSGLLYGSGEYFVRLGLGTPARSLFMVVDTGSDLPWLQCQPCKSCYKQADPIFDPRNSSSFQRIPCLSPLCKALEVHSCSGSRGATSRCSYQVAYGDGSFSVGDFSSDLFTLGTGSKAMSVAFGCGFDNEGLFAGAAGLLGLGAGKLSFPSQIFASSTNSSTANSFSYCLVDRSNPMTRSSSSLIFGVAAIPSTAALSPLLKNPKLDTFYYAAMIGVSVGGAQLPISLKSLQLSQSGSGGVIIDSGTSVTRFPTSVYATIRDAFRNATINLPSAPRYSLFDTCYNFSGKASVDVPALVLHFENGADLQLPPTNYLIPINTAGSFCLAFAPTSMELGIIGNIQQQSFRIGFDLQKSHLAFAPQQC
ncbi:hypothetical protein SELMODRAFT_54048, partial [Selaginella moellendorffii]